MINVKDFEVGEIYVMCANPSFPNPTNQQFVKYLGIGKSKGEGIYRFWHYKWSKETRWHLVGVEITRKATEKEKEEIIENEI